MGKNDFDQPENPFSLPRISFQQQECFLKTELCLILIIVSTSRKKTRKSVSISRNRLLLKIGLRVISISRKIRLFFKNLVLMSIMVSTSRNKSCEILSCLNNILLFRVLCQWKPLSKRGGEFLKKNFFAPSKNCFSHW